METAHTSAKPSKTDVDVVNWLASTFGDQTINREKGK